MIFDHEVMKKDFGEGFWKTSLLYEINNPNKNTLKFAI